jgi:hypothetical protein
MPLEGNYEAIEIIQTQPSLRQTEETQESASRYFKDSHQYVRELGLGDVALDPLKRDSLY